MRPLSCTTIVATIAFCSLALADDLSVTVTHPALAGYCVQTLRNALSQIQQGLSTCPSGLTPQQCDESTRPLRTAFDNEKRTFDLWRLYGLSLGADGTSEFLRGVAQANADIAYISDFVATHPLDLPPSASDEDFAKAEKAAAASDPRIQAIQDRQAECLRGPPL